MSLLYLQESANHILATATTVTGTSENSNLPWSNLQVPRQAEVGQMDTAALDDVVTADLGSAKSATFVSVHAHAIDSGVTSIQLLSDDNAGFATPTTRATLTTQDEAFFATFDVGAAERYWRLKFNGTNGDPIYLGAWGLGQHSTLAKLPVVGWELGYTMDQLRTSPELVTNRARQARRTVGMSWQLTTEAQKNELLDMLKDADWGELSTVVVPDDNDTVVLWCRLPGAIRFTRENLQGQQLGKWRAKLTIEEERFPALSK